MWAVDCVGVGYVRRGGWERKETHFYTCVGGGASFSLYNPRACYPIHTCPIRPRLLVSVGVGAGQLVLHASRCWHSHPLFTVLVMRDERTLVQERRRWVGTKATRSTCTDGGTTLTSLREGRRGRGGLSSLPGNKRAGLKPPSNLSARWGGVGNSSIIRRVFEGTCKESNS